MSNDHRKGILLALGAACGIATFVVPWKLAASHGSTTTNTLLLLVAAALFNSLLTCYQQRSLPAFGWFDLRVAAVLAALTLAGNLASGSAISLLSPALLTVVQRGEVIVVALLAWWVIGERVDARFWLGSAIAGLGLMVLQDPSGSVVVRSEGIAWGCASALCFGSMVVVTRRYIHRIDPASVNALRLWMSVALWFAIPGASAELEKINAPQVAYTSLAAFCGPFLGRLAMMSSSKYLEARITTLATLTAPPLTLLLGYVVLSDLPSAREMQGGLLMLVGISIPIFAWARQSR